MCWSETANGDTGSGFSTNVDASNEIKRHLARPPGADTDGELGAPL